MLDVCDERYVFQQVLCRLIDVIPPLEKIEFQLIERDVPLGLSYKFLRGAHAKSDESGYRGGNNDCHGTSKVLKYLIGGKAGHRG